MSARRTALPSWHRWSLWAALVLLLACMLATLVWLAGRHEAGQIQERLGRDAATAITDIRFALARDQQSLAVLGSGAAPNAAWQEQASALLQAQRALVRIEWRDADLHITAQAQSPYHPIDWNAAIRADPHGSAAMACANARRLTAPAYAGSYFQPYSDGLGAELLELCLPLAANGRMEGFIVATYALQDLLSTTTSHNLAGNQEVSFTDPDGTRLALIGATQRGPRLFTTQQLLNLNGTALVLRLDGWHSEPHLFPSLVTALVAAMALALAGVVAMLVAAFVVNFALGKFNPGFAAQPIAHSNHLWNFLGMVLAGLAFALAGGCPGRQLILSGEGDTDSGVFVIGMIVGAGIAHNFSLAGAADKMTDAVLQVGGPGFNGQIAIGLGLLFCLLLGFTMRERFE